ncbi:helix-turn-helix domain-containing protein [Streptomyces daliensis]|uniref:Helix-turn-helix transcriptional regulator n=1 Tax=Streptomyces daliensis TaxID=299421 RepID=A0A8T4IW65_9ACTN|nr:helix-turn-helix transcriptional regulator [Streptomyces daliensis]
MNVGERIRERRQQLGWSQERLAIEACRAAGVSTDSLGRQEIYRYEKGTRTPRDWLGPIAQALGMSAQTLGGDQPADNGSLSGIWRSEYTYTSTGKGEVARYHFMVIREVGNRLHVESLPGSNDSSVFLDLTRDGQALTGTWTERTSVAGYYKGAVYHGALQLLVELTGRSATGMWVGFDKEFVVNSGPWSLYFETADTSRRALSRFNRSPTP